MRIKLDENLPVQIASGLKLLGHDAHTADEEGLGGSRDEHIWKVTQREERSFQVLNGLPGVPAEPWTSFLMTFLA